MRFVTTYHTCRTLRLWISSHSSLWTFGILLEQAFVTELEKVKKQKNSLLINKQTIKVTEKGNQTDTTDIWQTQVIEKK